VASLTLVLAALFVIEGVLNLMLYARMRRLHGSSWVLIDGIITLLVGLMIYMQWPSSSVWAIGILVGVSLMISGATRIGMTLAVRRAVTAPEGTRLVGIDRIEMVNGPLFDLAQGCFLKARSSAYLTLLPIDLPRKCIHKLRMASYPMP
jgi:hypothetical protein